MQHITLFASGSGTNAINIIRYFRNHGEIKVGAVFCNRPEAPVIEKAKAEGIPVVLFDKKQFTAPGFAGQLNEYHTGWIILAGFLWLVPDFIVEEWNSRIINIHPALLPAYGGRGMYGHHVHEAVITAREPRSGITIHVVDNRYDHGLTLFQATCPVLPDDTPDALANRIHTLEHRWFPPVIENYIVHGINGVKQLDGNEAL